MFVYEAVTGHHMLQRNGWVACYRHDCRAGSIRAYGMSSTGWARCRSPDRYFHFGTDAAIWFNREAILHRRRRERNASCSGR